MTAVLGDRFGQCAFAPGVVARHAVPALAPGLAAAGDLRIVGCAIHVNVPLIAPY
jgi:hypothetical protein